MKFGLDVSQLVYRGTGVGRYVAGLTEALLSLNSDHQFVLFAGALRQYGTWRRLRHQSPYDRADWKIYPIPPRLAHLLFNVAGVPLDPLVGQLDVFHTSDWTEPALRIPKVTTVHDLAFRKYPETVDPMILQVQTARLKRIVSQATHIVADSLSTKQDLLDLYSIAKSRVTVIYPGINPSFRPAAAQAIKQVKAKYSLPDRFFLTLGTREPRKNLDRAIEAFKLFRMTPAGQNYSLVIAGRQGWGSPIHADSPHVQVTGYIAETDLPALYSAAKLLVYPSIYEGFGFPVVEAMACGTPAVSSNISSLPEIVGPAGVLADPLDPKSIAEGMAQALSQHAAFSRLTLKQAAKFTWEMCASQTLQLYESLAKNYERA